MNFLRKNVKTIIAFITGAVLIGGISTYAAYNYYASQVSYTKKDGTEVSVEKALNELYSNKQETSGDFVIPSWELSSAGGSEAYGTLYLPDVTNYNKLTIDSVTLNSGTFAYLKFWDNNR